MSGTDIEHGTDDESKAEDDLELKSIEDFQDEEALLHKSMGSTKSHGHAIRDA